MKCSPSLLSALLVLAIGACGGDRPPPEPPPDPTEPFEDPVTTTLGSGGVATTGPIMENNEPALGAKSTEALTGIGGIPGTSSLTTASGHSPSTDQEPIPHGPVGVGGTGTTSTTATFGSTGMGGRPLRGVTSQGSIH